MRLSKLKLAGFKTFVDPTTVLTSGQLVGVVGPNGCGKSNIIDAVRWVLGETRASALRGESMQDVIFNGSTARKPVSRASVELVFDNNEGRAAGQWSRYAEISVRRVLDRSGDSSYFINNVHVRRKDVIDLFLGTGLGPRAYAIIEQGMISRIIEARPEDIRGFLEEAAGVTKYRERRRETEGRLADARDNLLRLEDIRNELGERIAHLEVQAAQAERYHALNTAHIEKQQLLWLLRRNAAQAEHDGLVAALRRDSQQLETDNARLQELENAVSLVRERHLAASDQVHEAQSALFTASAEVGRIETELAHLAQTRTRVESRMTQLEEEQAEWAERQQGLFGEQARWVALAEHAGVRLAQAEARHEEVAGRLPEAEAARQDGEVTVNAARRALTQTEQQMRVEETRRASAGRALSMLEERQKRLETEGGAIEGPEARAVASARMRVESLEIQFEEGQARLLDIQGQIPAAQAVLERTRQEERQAQQQAGTVRARREALMQLQARVRTRGKLADWLRQHGLETWIPVWQGLRVTAGWERAVEVALRERLGALLAEDSADFDRVAEQAGIAPPPESLVVAAPFHGRGSDGWAGPSLSVNDLLPAALQVPEPLIDRITAGQEAPEGIAGLLGYWLAGWYAVPDLQVWIPQRQHLPAGVYLVCPQGQVLSCDGIMHLVPDERTQGVIERQRELDVLVQACDTLEVEAQQAHVAWEQAGETLAQLEAEGVRLRRDVQAVQAQLHAEEVALLKLEQASSRAEERRVQLARDLEDLVRLAETEQRHFEQAECEYERAQALVQLQREQLDAAIHVQNECEQQVRTLRTLEQGGVREVQEARFSVRECTGKQEEVARNLTVAAEQLDRILRERQALETTRLESDDSRGHAALEQALAMRAQREAVLAHCRNALEEAVAQVRHTEELRLSTEQSAVPVRERVAQLRLSVQAAALTVSQYAERLAEAEADEAALQQCLTADIQENTLQREVARLARALSDLGPVNLAALDELRAARERKGYLDVQSEDLLQAIETLEDAIRRIDRETREQLKATYNTVNQHFATLFPRLFGGGRAELVLTGEEILDAGIQIVAQPPGKKNASIHLLSGGEKALTAIALVFSMFQLNPAPFCMLDEVDAPLDDANTERYGQMVKQMSTQTQFIFISHNKITMEIASQLVGVTMQEQGVSRVVEVDMEAALRLTETVVA